MTPAAGDAALVAGETDGDCCVKTCTGFACSTGPSPSPLRFRFQGSRSWQREPPGDEASPLQKGSAFLLMQITASLHVAEKRERKPRHPRLL